MDAGLEILQRLTPAERSGRCEHADGDRLTEAELIANVILLFAAGFETTTNLIGNGVWTLLGRPDQVTRARDSTRPG